ncbi:MAG: nucleotidyltransferase [Lachnospiraceae bacterium]|nr:nucleotidyltransferase [Lachnospiraceae bacterium]
MKTAAIICEYNPFHNGHLYQIEQIKSQLAVDHILAVMSGDFVQRGTPAFCGKYTRAELALKNGVDLVLELPVCYASASAEYFAYGGISLLDSLNCVDYLVFGTEAGNLQSLKNCARLFTEEPKDYRELLQNQLKKGLSFPAARAYSASKILGTDMSALLSAPNNILAIEYLKALSKCGSPIEPYTIQRMGSDYHDTNMTCFSSATGIRTEIMRHGIQPDLESAVPHDTFRYFKTFYHTDFPVIFNDFSEMMYYQLITEPHPERYLDYHPELMDRIMKKHKSFCDIETLISDVKSRNFTHARISRYLLHLLLKITEEQASSSCQYAKILGMKKSHSKCIKHLNKSSSIPIIQKISQYKSVLDGDALSSFEQTLRATELYRYTVNKKYQTKRVSEFAQSLLIV